jgi:hypothetical protein
LEHRERRRIVKKLLFVGMMILCSVQVAGAEAIISNGTVMLGVNDQGHLNVSNAAGTVPISSGGTIPVGLRYVPTNAESTAPGCLCEGWGVANAGDGTTGYANISVDGGPVNLGLVSFTNTASTAVSTVNVTGGTSGIQVVHDYHPSTSANLYEVTVSITNTGASAISDLRYRRVMDWDVDPTTFREYVTIQGGAAATDVLFTSNNGFASANPLSGPSDIGFIGDFVNQGPDDHGALFDFGFGALAAGDTFTFRTFYGAAGTIADAMTALGAVGAEVYSLGMPSSFAPGDASFGEPNTFIFAFAGVGGDPVIPTPEPGTLVLLGSGLVGLIASRRRSL